MHHRKRKTRIYPAPVDMDRAGAALPVVAPFFGPRQSDVLAEAIDVPSPLFLLILSDIVSEFGFRA
jgi:hypothetical protein